MLLTEELGPLLNYPMNKSLCRCMLLDNDLLLPVRRSSGLCCSFESSAGAVFMLLIQKRLAQCVLP